MVNTMARVKYNNAEFLQGITQPNSGTLLFLKFNRKGVVMLYDENVHVKRPGQYQKKMS